MHCVSLPLHLGSAVVSLQAQAATLRRVGQGGLNEDALELVEGAGRSGGDAAGRREHENVSTVDIVRHPSEAEQVLRMLPAHLRGLKHLPARAGAEAQLCPCLQSIKWFTLHAESLRVQRESQRKLYKCRWMPRLAPSERAHKSEGGQCGPSMCCVHSCMWGALMVR